MDDFYLLLNLKFRTKLLHRSLNQIQKCGLKPVLRLINNYGFLKPEFDLKFGFKQFKTEDCKVLTSVLAQLNTNLRCLFTSAY